LRTEDSKNAFSNLTWSWMQLCNRLLTHRSALLQQILLLIMPTQSEPWSKKYLFLRTRNVITYVNYKRKNRISNVKRMNGLTYMAG